MVTGANGFIGAHVVRALLEDRVEVRALIRPTADRRSLQGLDIEVVEGDFTRPEEIDAALDGIDALFHVAARYDLARSAAREVIAVNVKGTRTVMEAALRRQVGRVVHTSSVATIGPPRGANLAGAVADESQHADPARAPGPYERSKVLSERLVLRLARDEGLPAIAVLPTAPIGPLDLKPTPTGRLIADAATGRLPAIVASAGLNVVDVRDVARGHALAARHGRIGERYILGHAEGNLALAQIAARAAAAGGADSPKRIIPAWLAMAAALLDEASAPLLRRTPRATIAGVRLARRRQWFTPAKAIAELGLPQTDLDIAFADAVRGFLHDRDGVA